jgi:teichuronic acid exporter
MSLKQKTVAGLFWSFVENFVLISISFIVGIILARLLSPKEYGLIGVMTIFISMSQSFIDSGFSQALMRKQNCTPSDYSTVFYFNITVSIFVYLILFFCATYIGSFFHEPILADVIKVLGLGLIINSTSLIQSTQLTKQIDFKSQAKISLISSLSSGIISIYMAYSGWGVWSLVASAIVRYSINSFCLWFWSKWKPIWCFSINSLKELFAFGGNLFISGLIDATYRNIFTLIIGKYYSAAELGYYTRADQFQALPSSNLQTVIGRVSLPVLLTIQDDIPRLKESYRKIIKISMFLSFLLMLGMVATARPLVLALIGEKWEPSIIYLQLLSLIGMLYPLHAINLNMLQVQGRSDLFLKLEIIKKIVVSPVLFVGIFLGIKVMILGLFIVNIFGLYLNSYWSGKMIRYSFWDQLKDITPSFLLAIIVNSLVFLEGIFIPLRPVLLLIIQLSTGLILTIGLCEFLKHKDYIFIKEIAKKKLKDRLSFKVPSIRLG